MFRDLLRQIESFVEMTVLFSVGSEVELEGLFDSRDGARDGEKVEEGVRGEEPVKGSFQLRRGGGRGEEERERGEKMSSWREGGRGEGKR